MGKARAFERGELIQPGADENGPEGERHPALPLGAGQVGNNRAAGLDKDVDEQAGSQTSRYPAMKIQVGMVMIRTRRAWAAAKVSTIGVMAGSIIAAIITVHIATNATASCSDQTTTGVPVIAIPLMLSMLMPSIVEPLGTAMPVGLAMTKA
jgi:hypothetical protein